jgi:hypothetical protein
MIRIAITQAAFDAIVATLPLGSVSYENAFNERGERLRLVAAQRGRPAPGPAPTRRELQRRHFAVAAVEPRYGRCKKAAKHPRPLQLNESILACNIAAYPRMNMS